MTYITIAMVGRPPQSIDAVTLGDAVDALGIDASETTFRCGGQTVDLDFQPTEPVTVLGAKNLVGA